MKNGTIDLGNPLALLRLSISTLISNPIILYPFTILAFIQLLILEIIFFAPRYPLVTFFNPLIAKTEGAIFLHYPYTFLLLSKWFHLLQTPLYLFVNSLILGVVVVMVHQLNTDNGVNIARAFKSSRSAYIHLFLAALVVVVSLQAFSYGYGLIIKRALQIKSTTGILFFLKQAVLLTSPMGSLFLACLVTSLFAFVIPLIVIDRQKIIRALEGNFSRIFSSLGTILGVTIISSLVYLPVLILESKRRVDITFNVPELSGALIVISVFAMLLIDAVQYTAITIYFLAKKESS